MTTCSLVYHISCRVFWWNNKSPRWLSPLQPRFGALQLLAFPKTKITFESKRFQTTDEVQKNTTGWLMAIGRTVWGPKVPTLNGTEASLSYVQCFLCLVSSSINVSIFHITWLASFWTDLIYIKPYYNLRFFLDWKFIGKAATWRIYPLRKNIWFSYRRNTDYSGSLDKFCM